jgi:shikimate dehydrogenase
MLCGILLHPAAHTRSPAMHNAAFAALGLDAVFLAFDVAPSALGAAVAGARVPGVRQLAISLPHKEAVLAHLEAVDDTARRIGAANTVTLRDGRFVGENTDWIGLARALERETALEGRTAVVLGAGGTARAAVFALRQRGATVHVLNRTVASAERLVVGGECRPVLDPRCLLHPARRPVDHGTRGDAHRCRRLPYRVTPPVHRIAQRLR